MSASPRARAGGSILRVLLRDQATMLLMLGLASLVLVNVLLYTRSGAGVARQPQVAERPAQQPSSPPTAPVPSSVPQAQPPAAPGKGMAVAEPAPAAKADPQGTPAAEPQVAAVSQPPQPAAAQPVIVPYPAPAATPAVATPENLAAPAPQPAAMPEADPRQRRVTIGTYLRSAPAIGSTKVVRVAPGEPILLLDTIENADGASWHRVEAEYAKGYLPAFALDESDRARERAKAVFGVVGGVVDAATIEVAGRQVRLWGISSSPGTWNDQFRDRMLRDSPTVTCLAREDERFRCITEDLVDLAELVLLNGAVRTDLAAPPLYLERELEAQKASRGLWKR